MAIDVYSVQRPAAPHRAVLLSAAFLLATCGLALQMTWSRSGAGLGEVLRPTGWGVAFRFPTGFVLGDTVNTDVGHAQPGQRRTQGGSTVEIVAWLITARPGESPAQWIEHVEEHLRGGRGRPALRSLQRPTRIISSQRIGTRAATEVRDPAEGLVIRSAVGDRGEALCVSLRFDLSPVDAARFPVLFVEEYTRFDKLCRSFQFDIP